MKFRKGFVSNSSSSSFLILEDEEIIPKGINYVELSELQVRRAKRYYLESWDYKYYDEKIEEKYGNMTLKEIKNNPDVNLDHYYWKKWIKNRIMDSLRETSSVFLTEFISDSLDENRVLSNDMSAISFMEGNHGTPYDPDSLEILKKGKSEYDTIYFLEPIPKSVQYVHDLNRK